MTEFKAGDRVQYTSAGSVRGLHGKRGTVNGLTRNGWIEVDFDIDENGNCPGLGIKCADISLRHLGERERTNKDVKPLLERPVTVDADEALEALAAIVRDHVPEERRGDIDKAIRTLTHTIAGYGQLTSAMRTLVAQVQHAARADTGAVMAIKRIHTEDIYIKVK
jgi:hypothetical protein